MTTSSGASFSFDMTSTNPSFASLRVGVNLAPPNPCNPSTFVTLNPQPLPPGGGGFPNTLAFGFQFVTITTTDPPFTVDFTVTDLNNGHQLSFAAPNATPEPGSLILMGTGVVGLCGYAWRKRRTPALP